MAENRIIDVDFPEKEVEELKQIRPSSESFNIEVITPMFGGGVKAGEADDSFLIRPSSIRGHLRFWWRATRGSQCKTEDILRQREGEIWGNTLNPSKVSISVEVTDRGEIFESNDPKFGYILFPFRQNRNKGVNKIKFSLKVDAPQEIIKTEVYPALKAWVNFGGVGARTRRGCGALYCEELAFNFNNENWYHDFLIEYNYSLENIRGWPTIPSSILISKSSYPDSDECWANTIKPLREFRQGPGIGRDKGFNRRFGRSFWPEAESVRELIVAQRKINRPSYWHDKDRNVYPGSYPRVEFGMPIILEIRGEDIKPTLKPGKNIERMASPIILRPLKCKKGKNNYKYTSIIMQLQKPQLNEAYIEPGLVFPEERSNYKTDLLEGVTITSDEIRVQSINTSYIRHPIRKRSSNNSALEAFMNYAKDNNFKEVGR